jgi:hypothetical protein
MILPKINLPSGFYKLAVDNTVTSLQRLNISPFALTTIALAANERLLCGNELLSVTPSNIFPLFKKSLAQLKAHINSFESPYIHLHLAMKNSSDHVEFDEVATSLGMYFNATIDGYMSVDFTVKNPIKNTKTRRVQKILSLIAQRMDWLVPSQSALTLNDNTLECTIFEGFNKNCIALKIAVSPENFLKLNPHNDLGIETINVAQAFISAQSWHHKKRSLINKKKISKEIKKLNNIPIAGCLAQIHKELESVIAKFQQHCQNHFGYGEETLTHDKGLFIFGGFPDEVFMIDDEINMMGQVCEPIEDIFYPNKTEGLTHALDYYQAIQDFCQNTNSSLKPYR